MKKLVVLIVLSLCSILTASIYDIEMTWDEFAAECSSYLTGSIDNKVEFVEGIREGIAHKGKLVSLGEDHSSFSPVQKFRIDSEYGYFSFWIKDKFSDDDLNTDPTKIAAAKPVIRIFQNGSLIDQINVPEGSGLVCKVFNLDAETGDIDKELKYYPRSRMIIGNVIDCISAEAITGANVILTGEMGKSHSLTTDESGFFMFPCEIGHYEISITKEGYIGNSSSIAMGIDESPRELVIALSETVKNYRIVLTWGSRPRDLDAHLSGPNPDGGDFHIWYRDHYPIGGKDFLDRDDTRSYGPETITIYKPAKGVYRYSVYDYSHRKSKRSKGLMRSGAKVDLYGEGRLLKSFNVPEGRGNCWHVFEIDQNNNIVNLDGKITYCKDDKEIHN